MDYKNGFMILREDSCGDAEIFIGEGLIKTILTQKCTELLKQMGRAEEFQVSLNKMSVVKSDKDGEFGGLQIWLRRAAKKS
jgi:hypothetical protein